MLKVYESWWGDSLLEYIVIDTSMKHVIVSKGESISMPTEMVIGYSYERSLGSHSMDAHGRMFITADSVYLMDEAPEDWAELVREAHEKYIERIGGE